MYYFLKTGETWMNKENHINSIFDFERFFFFFRSVHPV